MNYSSTLRCLMTALLLWAPAGMSQQEANEPESPQKPTAEAAVAYPAAMTLPIKALGVDRKYQADAAKELETIRQALDQMFINNATDLNAYIGDRSRLTLNLSRVTGQIMTGPGKVDREDPIYLAPLWCSVMDHYVLILQIGDTRRGLILASAHLAIAKNSWQQLVQQKSLARTIAPDLQNTFNQARGKLQPYALTDALAVGLNVGHGLSRNDETTGACLNQLLSEQLATRYQMPAQTNLSVLGSIRRALKQPSKMRRPTRMLNMQWFVRGERALPTKLALQSTFAESVFAQPIKGVHKSDWDISLTGKTINLPVSPDLEEFLKQEQGSLLAKDKPQVAKIFRAWVYLDKGRAWGLKMRDRLVADVDGKVVKGHVVRFFGPEAGIVSPKGYPVHEGAIVYIRKGQKDTKVGMTFAPDPRKFPTPWPPKKGM